MFINISKMWLRGISHVFIACWTIMFNRVTVSNMEGVSMCLELKLGCVFWPCSGYSYLIRDHMRAVHLYISALENSCPLMAFPCTNYKDFLAGQCLDCFNPFLLSCPRIGKCSSFDSLWQLGESSSLVTSLSPDLLWSKSLFKLGKENLSNVQNSARRCSHLEGGL